MSLRYGSTGIHSIRLTITGFRNWELDRNLQGGYIGAVKLPG